jgi:hypothetical protein
MLGALPANELVAWLTILVLALAFVFTYPSD